MNISIFRLSFFLNNDLSPFINLNQNLVILNSNFQNFFSNFYYSYKKNLLLVKNCNFNHFLSSIFILNELIYTKININYSINSLEQVKFEFCKFLNILSTQSGGGIYFSILNQKIEIFNSLFYNCRTTGEFGGGFFINNGLSILNNLCLINCRAQFAHAFRISNSNPNISNLLVHFCTFDFNGGGYGSFYINSPINEFNFLNSSHNIVYGHGTGFYIEYSSSKNFNFLNFFNCSSMGIIIIYYCNDLRINYINFISNIETKDGIIWIGDSNPVYFNNSIFLNNFGNFLFYGYNSNSTAIFLNSIFDFNKDNKATYLFNNLFNQNNIFPFNFKLLNYDRCFNFKNFTIPIKSLSNFVLLLIIFQF